MKHPPFSEAEMRVIRELKPEWADLIERKNWDSGVMTTFWMLAEYCFLYEINNQASKAFRNAYRAVLESKVSHGTPQYEQLLTY